MKNLSELTWKDFKIENVFAVEKGIYLHQKDILEGQIPYITAKSINNGINAFIGNEKLFNKNTITIEKVKLSAFYQPTSYYCSHDVSVIKNDKLNKDNSLFIASMITRQGSKYSYGRQAQMNVVKRETLFCPIDDHREPDYEYMEDYTKSIIDKKLEKYKTYANSTLNSIKYKELEKLEDKEWKEFFLTDVFAKIQRGKRLITSNQQDGNKPYVSSTALNNGIDNFISNQGSVRVFSNCLSIANSGSVGASFYHPYEFVASDHITHLKKEDMSKFVYLFISTLTNGLSKKYNFNREINDKRISREKILLPVNDQEKPDYEYMEQYMKNLMHKKIKQYLDYLEKQSS